MNGPVVPNLFLVGAPRCGTTAMFKTLSRHPDVSVCATKEPYYFRTDFHEESDRHHGKSMRFPVRAEEQYLALFPALFPEPGQRIVAEATPVYLRSRVNLKPASRPPIDPGLRADLMSRFRPEVEQLSRVLERDLVSLWGYDGSRKAAL